MSETVQGRKVWTPPEGKTRMDLFRERVNKEHGLDLQDYAALHEWSITHTGPFWQAVWDEMEIVASQPAVEVIPENAPMFPPAEWFPGARLNVAENLLKHGRDDDVALIACTEREDDTHRMTYKELRSHVACATRALRKLGIKPGDTVASYSSNTPENLIAFLASSAVGAVWTSVAPDFGTAGVLERLLTVRPRVLFSVNAVLYNGKLHDHIEKLNSTIVGLLADRHKPSAEAEPAESERQTKRPRLHASESLLEHVVVVPYSGSHSEKEQRKTGVEVMDQDGDLQRHLWSDFLASGEGSDAIEYEQLDFNHALWILFSSGTTGKPKAITHRAGGMLIQFGKEHLLHGGLTREDVFFQHTTTGWMMWNWLVGALLGGCSLVLYDGSPAFPTGILWERAAQLGITVFGTSAAYLSLIERRNYVPTELHDKLKVRMILSTGSPLRAELYLYAEKLVGRPVMVGSITGGTDLCSLFADHNESLPVYAGELQCLGLGMDVDVYDAQGQSQPDMVEGDLVCKKPFPAQPLGFWHQPNERYRDSYYTQYPGVWYHGDLVMRSPRGGLIMLGRSDGILNPSGIRFGSAEIYEVLESSEAISESSPLSKITDSLVVALKTPAKDDEVVVLFLVVPEDAEWDSLVASVKALIRKQRSARHVPAYIRRVGGCPKTLNGKRVEVPVKKLINGAPLSTINQATLLNPEVLQEYIDIGEQLRAELANAKNAQGPAAAPAPAPAPSAGAS